MNVVRKVLYGLSIVFIAVGTVHVLFSISIFGLSEIIIKIAYASGLLLYCATKLNKWKFFSSKPMAELLLIGLLLFTFSNTQAQSLAYQKQIEALERGFIEKSIDPVKPYISPELKFFTYPAAATQQILSQVFANMPALQTITISETKTGQISAVYEFAALGKRNSNIEFDESGRITKIELIDELLEEQQKAQEAMKNSVQKPTPGKNFPPEKVSFSSRDGLTVVGHLYESNQQDPVLLLCHQANMNKYEYAGIAPKLAKMGFNVLAIDQRSGGDFAGHTNETLSNAKAEGITGISYADAYQDMEAAVDYLVNKFEKKVTVWGSSYSSSLALMAALNHDGINAAIAFSPGDYFGDQKPLLQTTLQKLNKPFFITSSKEQAQELADRMEQITPGKNKIQFIPKSDGFHGSRALWEGQQGAEEYWAAIKGFLSQIYPM